MAEAGAGARKEAQPSVSLRAAACSVGRARAARAARAWRDLTRRGVRLWEARLELHGLARMSRAQGYSRALTHEATNARCRCLGARRRHGITDGVVDRFRHKVPRWINGSHVVCCSSLLQVRSISTPCPHKLRTHAAAPKATGPSRTDVTETCRLGGPLANSETPHWPGGRCGVELR